MQKNPVQCQFVVALDSSPKVEYSITEYGMSLSPILETLHQWGCPIWRGSSSKKRKMKIQNQNRDHQESRKELVPVHVQ
ncbi:winged helix-turn-helix transcriptional regulator [Paenibacillus illinoisensis]|uniref:Putative HTH-type transcriptional regulator YtcD n=1 Tax=Paenibacillus illinoisensis TaxID=59845 RepID=A0A2W0C7B4_9BACL|nr:putative HTH-type transcriptional regulator YtcD [Paenibacillus illinoisensis]